MAKEIPKQTKIDKRTLPKRRKPQMLQGCEKRELLDIIGRNVN
jgi:hypothetical protein